MANDKTPPADSPPDAEGAARDLRKAVVRFAKRARRKLLKHTTDMEACEEAPTLRRHGELLKAALGEVRRGQTEAVVRDFYSNDSAATVTISLDPSRPPAETMRKLFKRAGKLERGRERIAEQLALTKAAIAALALLVDDLDTALADGLISEELDPSFIERTRLLGVPLPQAAASLKPTRQLSKRQKVREALLRGVREFTSRDGLTIYVGRTDRDNDALTFRLANGSDHWFHLAPAAGSHVVARLPSGTSLPQETLIDAAHLAVHFSKMRGATKADVTHTQARHIRRIRGAPPGKVRVERSETILVRIEPKRIARLTGKERV